MTLGLLAAIALSILAEMLFIQRLFTAPRLILTVATIGIAQFAATVQIILGRLRNVSGVAPQCRAAVSTSASRWG